MAEGNRSRSRGPQHARFGVMGWSSGRKKSQSGGRLRLALFC